MLLYAFNRATEFFDDVGYNSRRVFTHVAGKGGIVGAKEVVPALIGLGGHGAALMVAAPLSAALSSAIVQGDHLHRRGQLVEQYRPEIAAWLSQQTGRQKTPESVVEADLYLAAYGDKKQGITSNPTLKEALDKSRTERNWGIGISVLSSVASAAILTGLMGAGGPLHAEGAAKILVGGLVGFATYLPISTALHWVSEQFFGVEKVTTGDRVTDIHRARARGKTISQEKVFEVFVEAHPELDSTIRAGFGSYFDRLQAGQKQKVLEAIGSQIGLEKMTEDINLGRMRAEELAFAAHGQISGVRPEAPEAGVAVSGGVLSRAWQHCASVFARKGQAQTVSAGAIAQVHVQAGVESGAQADAHAEQQPGRNLSFVQRLGGRKNMDGSLTFVEQLEHSRAGAEAQLT